MIKHNSTAASVLVAALGVGLLGSGTAYGFWTTRGVGTATASASSATPVSVTATATTALYPGLKSSATVTFSNPNLFAVTVTSITPTGGVTVTNGQAASGTLPACDGSTAGVVFATITGSWTVPAKLNGVNGTIAPVTVPDAVEMLTTSASRCQGATFTQSYS